MCKLVDVEAESEPIKSDIFYSLYITTYSKSRILATSDKIPRPTSSASYNKDNLLTLTTCKSWDKAASGIAIYKGSNNDSSIPSFCPIMFLSLLSGFIFLL